MKWTQRDILKILDQCCDDFTFPMLDNGYVYLAATRLSLYRSEDDWGLVIEVFGFSPRSGLPDTQIYTFASRLHERDPEEKYEDRDAYNNYLKNNPHNESRFVYPIAEGNWQDEEEPELLAQEASTVHLRDRDIPFPPPDKWSDQGVQLEEPDEPQIFEFCRFVAATERSSVLATSDERSISIRPEMTQLLQLEEWNHPNVVDEDERPSGSETFCQLAEVLVSGDVSRYSPTLQSNTHWRNWPDGGSL